ncbi:hypothetical protein, partial [Corallococcus exercitus]|uniref:hypothetical protein n=1 Tax=Corallococcus exercitus TaxID=2316736 RepID=UPI001C12381C
YSTMPHQPGVRVIYATGYCSLLRSAGGVYLMADGMNDLTNLFSRVSALEQADADSDLTVARIVKVYDTLGIKVTVRASIHQYWICGQTDPITGSIITCSTTRIL